MQYLVEGDAAEEHDHVDDFVEDNFPLKTNEEEHCPTHVDPVFNKHPGNHGN